MDFNRISKDTVELVVKHIKSLPNQKVPAQLREPGGWLAMARPGALGILFLDKSNWAKSQNLLEKKQDPFPGLFTTDPTISAFASGHIQNGYLKSNSTYNAYVIQVLPNTSYVIENHKHVIAMEDFRIDFNIAFGLILGLKLDENWQNISERITDLLNFAISVWEMDIAS